MKQSHRRQSAFTLVEIMVVVLIVGILSSLSMFAIGRIKERSARSVIQNNLRQYYDAKEYFYAETGFPQLITPVSLQTKNYIKASLKAQLMSHTSFESNLGWRYQFIAWPGLPVYAFRGEDPLVRRGPHQEPTFKKTSGEVIWYPGPPDDLQ